MTDENNIICESCKYCKRKINETDNIINLNTEDVINKCSDWLERCSIECDSVGTESCTGSSGISEFTETTENSAMDSGLVFQNDGLKCANSVISQFTADNNVDLEKIVNENRNNYTNITVTKSKKVHIGDVNYIQGPVYINNFNPTLNQNIVINNTVKDNQTCPYIINRRNWLAQPAVQPLAPLNMPVKFVIISHSATEDAYTLAENVLIVRLIQTFHIESRKWDDIAYNFLISADGNIFEGRGWNSIGSHSLKYNSFSLGINFIGCYNNYLPPKIALKRAQELIKYGVNIGAIAEDYSLLGHRQISSVESPGQSLFEEISKWANFDDSINIQNPSPIVSHLLP